ncbi:hypothetical protein L2E82_27921 [Cichorium intybus]|uniref:Uncharacterized protein n=1 Tax=Cichorium intybus TaxID=13427 RepID=A0ACB9CUK5_CICIN|nr:hypothetical protein L2E82_27921 [Cichorium intybus]
MAKKYDTRSIKGLSKSSCQVQRNSDPVKTEEPELAPVTFRRQTRSMSLRSLPAPKIGDPDTFMQTETDEPHGTVQLWRGNDVGREVKALLEAIDHRYPNTFQGVNIRANTLWSTILKELHLVIKGFMETTVDAVVEEQITTLRENLEEYERLGFDLSWAHKRVDVVDMLMFGNEPLQKELIAIEEMLKPLNENVGRRWKELMEAHDMWKKAQCDYDNAKDARDKKAEEMTQKFGAEYDSIMKGRLGFGILPGY